MTTDNATLVTRFCQSLLDADMAQTCRYLTADVLYHNMPWAPVTGHAAVRQVLDPLVHGANCALREMAIEVGLEKVEVRPLPMLLHRGARTPDAHVPWQVLIARRAR